MNRRSSPHRKKCLFDVFVGLSPDQGITHLGPALVLDRRGVRYDHRSDQALSFGWGDYMLGSAKVFLFGGLGFARFFLFVADSRVCSFGPSANVWPVRTRAFVMIARFSASNRGRVLPNTVILQEHTKAATSGPSTFRGLTQAPVQTRRRCCQKKSHLEAGF